MVAKSNTFKNRVEITWNMYVTAFSFVVSIELQHVIKVLKTFLLFKRNTQNNKTGNSIRCSKMLLCRQNKRLKILLETSFI